MAFTKRSPIQIVDSIKNFHLQFISIELIQHLLQYMPNDTEVDILRITINDSCWNLLEVMMNKFDAIKKKTPSFILNALLQIKIQKRKRNKMCIDRPGMSVY